MNIDLQRVALRHNSLYFSNEALAVTDFAELKSHTLYALGELRKCGLGLSERALRAFNTLSAREQGEILEVISDIYALKMNWTPLVRNWLTPTGQSRFDMLYTYLYNLEDRVSEDSLPGVRLSCGHIMPPGVFDLPRYTGCPFCGTPFEISDKVNFGQGSKIKVLEPMSEPDMTELMRRLLEMRVPLDPTQSDSLTLLMEHFPIPKDVTISMKETLMLVMSYYIDSGRPECLSGLIKSPVDVLRYLWYQHTGLSKIIRPRTLIGQSAALWNHICPSQDKSEEKVAARKKALRVRFPRRIGRIVAQLLNAIEMPPRQQCALMHPYRQMWVHMIRALHLNEYAKKQGFDRLKIFLDLFYRGDYSVPQGEVDRARLQLDQSATLQLLRQRPGAFARQLFANMIWFTPSVVLNEFRKVLSELPTRLIIGLGNAAVQYFNPEGIRQVRIITNQIVQVKKNAGIFSFSSKERAEMVEAINGLLEDALSLKYGMMPRCENNYIYIDPILEECALPVSDRGVSVQDIGSALPGMRFKVEGDRVRLFLYWGEGMPAQPLDLDLSAMIAYDDHCDLCYFGCLTLPGAQHSGDMRAIPDEKGTAEYIELDIAVLKKSGAKYVIFSAANYSGGALPPNTRMGWMSSDFPMTVDESNGVAFDPSCVQMMVRLPQHMDQRTMHFGVLDVDAREIIYIEYPDNQQVVGSGTTEAVISLLKKIRDKLTIGRALRMMAQAQGLVQVTKEQLEADPALLPLTAIYDSHSLSNIPELLQTLIPE